MDIVTIAMGLAQFAPAVIRWLTGSKDAEIVARDVVSVAQTITGSASPQEALARIQADQTAQRAFRQALLERATEMDKAYLADVQSARARDVELSKVRGNNTRADVMVIAAVVGLVSCLAVLILFKGSIPGEAVGIISTVAGIFGACMKDAYSFEFGSSRGSKEKDDVIGEIARMP
ncbi:MAG TPA: hypothetical protein VJ396_06955 [Acidiferrobacterales bacterium]|nr:hypothetical protein [Acidiferrobacterales bacterium]